MKVWKPFEPLFIKRVKSKYGEKYTFATVTQLQALSLTEDLEMRQKYEQHHGLLAENPLHLNDFFFAGVDREIGMINYDYAIFYIMP